MHNQNQGYNLNASLATMDPNTFQNSPYVSGMGQNFGVQQSTNMTPTVSQFRGQAQPGMVNASLASMSPDSYFSSPFVNQGSIQNQSMSNMGSNQHLNFTPNKSQFSGQPQMGMVGASLATMGPDTYLNSPYNQGGYQMSQGMQQQMPQMGQQYSQQMPQVGQQYGQQMNYTPNVSQFTGQTQQGMVNASLATMNVDSYMNSPYTQSGYQMGQGMQQQPNMGLQASYGSSPLSSQATQDPSTYENFQSFMQS